jgi:asparagine synthase (glutamine-hydrolysing)
MVSANGRYVITYNGEVYNFRDLRTTLEVSGHTFRGFSDTEVVLAAISQWGVRDAVQRFVGMFAFALWDREQKALHLVRDRLGIKPLFVGRSHEGDLLFSSELKALVAHPGFARELDASALAQYLRYGYIPAPRTIYRSAAKILPGTIVSFRSPSDSWTAFEPYWSIEDTVNRGASQPFAGDLDDATTQLDELLRVAVRARMIADVPLGAFLSGGIDSSTVVALMQSQSSTPVRTFSIGFTEAKYDESHFARSVANHLSTAHTELVVTPTEAREVIPKIATMFDEPFADVSQIPTYLVAVLARREVTVALSGDGGDELFAGYDRYRTVRRLDSAMSVLPRSLRHGLAHAIRALDGCEPMQPALRLFPATIPFNWRMMSNIRDPRALMAVETDAQDEMQRLLRRNLNLDLIPHMMLADAKIYLPDDLLTKLDRSTMAVSLEGRLPLLDHRVVEFAWSLPFQFKQRRRGTKWIFKRVLGRYLPQKLFERKKMGFEVPIGQWLRGPLVSQADSLLEYERLRDARVLDPTAVRKVWDSHRKNHYDASHLLWSLLVFEMWRERWGVTM